VKEDGLGRACSTNGENMNTYRVWMGKQDGKRSGNRFRRRWEIILKMFLAWVYLTQDRDQ
jgi:hypothetical protein